jgi:hypothetical protein
VIDNDAWRDILLSATDLSTVVEIYGSDATPADNGFDPNDAIQCFAAASGITFMGVDYTRLITKIGNINRKISKVSNTASVEFSNLSGEISAFEFANGFEGLLMVIRLISRGSSVDQDTSQVLFTGRCEKPQSGNRKAFSITATWILGGLEVEIPRRKFVAEDQEGRVTTDPEFEGFEFMPQYGTVSYSVRVKRGGILGFFGFKKTVQKTLAYSSHSDLDANKSVPEIFGRSQILGTHIAYADVGSVIRIRTAFCEGEIEDIQNARSVQSLLALSATNYVETYGVTGAANAIAPTWPGAGNYSRTAGITGQCSNTAVDVDEPAPDIAAVILGRLMTVPDGSGDWVTSDTWTDNAAAHTRFVLTSDDYFKLDENWIEDADFYEAYQFNDENIIDRSLTDFVFVVAG